MRILPDGRIWLQEGETVPVWCKCGTVYQPSPGSLKSVCHGCGQMVIHCEQRGVKLVEEHGR